MGVDIPSLGSHSGTPRVHRPRVARELPSDADLVRIGKGVLLDVAEAEEQDGRARVAAASHLIATARQDLALSGPGKARSAAEMLEAVRRALPELERRAAAEQGAKPAEPDEDDDGTW